MVNLYDIRKRAQEAADPQHENTQIIQSQTEMPFKGAETGLESFEPSFAVNPPSENENALKRLKTPLTGNDAKRNYRAMYRAACNYHERHNPPAVESAYWQTHIPGEDETPQAEAEYWADAARDASKTASSFKQDPFFIGLLAAVYSELEREYSTMREAAANEQSA